MDEHDKQRDIEAEGQRAAIYHNRTVAKPWLGRDGLLGPVATDGQRYVTVCCTGIKQEGEPPVLVSTPEEAWRQYNETLSAMAHTHHESTIEWRARPTLHTSIEKRHGKKPLTRYWVRSRLAFVLN